MNHRECYFASKINGLLNACFTEWLIICDIVSTAWYIGLFCELLKWINEGFMYSYIKTDHFKLKKLLKLLNLLELFSCIYMQSRKSYKFLLSNYIVILGKKDLGRGGILVKTTFSFFVVTKSFLFDYASWALKGFTKLLFKGEKN